MVVEHEFVLLLDICPLPMSHWTKASPGIVQSNVTDLADIFTVDQSPTRVGSQNIDRFRTLR